MFISGHRITLFSLLLMSLALAGLPLNHATATHPPPDSTEQDPTDAELRILFTGHLNFDCHADTVFGKPDHRFNYLPRAIHWGTGTEGAGAEDTACGSATPKKQRVKKTTITYPGWGNFSGAVAFQRLNPDTLTDIIFYIWGKTGNGQSQRDSMRAVAVFGQDALDAAHVIRVGEIGTFQDAPYFAMELRTGSELAKPGARDLSGRRSYELLPVGLDVDEADTTERAAPLAGTDARIAVRVYPNPADNAAQLESETIPPGRYRVEVVAVNGQVHHSEDVEVEGGKRLVETFDMRRLPSGYYVVRLQREGKIVGSYPIAVTR